MTFCGIMENEISTLSTILFSVSNRYVNALAPSLSFTWNYRLHREK